MKTFSNFSSYFRTNFLLHLFHCYHIWQFCNMACQAMIVFFSICNICFSLGVFSWFRMILEAKLCNKSLCRKVQHNMSGNTLFSLYVFTSNIVFNFKEMLILIFVLYYKLNIIFPQHLQVFEFKFFILLKLCPTKRKIGFPHIWQRRAPRIVINFNFAIIRDIFSFSSQISLGNERFRNEALK